MKIENEISIKVFSSHKTKAKKRARNGERGRVKRTAFAYANWVPEMLRNQSNAIRCGRGKQNNDKLLMMTSGRASRRVNCFCFKLCGCA